MAIIHKFDQAGGFAAGDTETGLISYAFPNSPYAVEAKLNATKVAAEMMSLEDPLDSFPAWSRDRLAAQNARMMAWLQSNSTTRP